MSYRAPFKPIDGPEDYIDGHGQGCGFRHLSCLIELYIQKNEPNIQLPLGGVGYRSRLLSTTYRKVLSSTLRGAVSFGSRAKDLFFWAASTLNAFRAYRPEPISLHEAKHAVEITFRLSDRCCTILLGQCVYDFSCSLPSRSRRHWSCFHWMCRTSTGSNGTSVSPCPRFWL